MPPDTAPIACRMYGLISWYACDANVSSGGYSCAALRAALRPRGGGGGAGAGGGMRPTCGGEARALIPGAAAVKAPRICWTGISTTPSHITAAMAMNVISNQPMTSGGVSKVTPQGSVVINCGLSTQEYMYRKSTGESGAVYGNLDERTFSIARGELVFAKRSGDLHINMGKNSPSVGVFSSFNGIHADKNLMSALVKPGDVPDKRQAYSRLANDYWFVGTAQGDKGKRDMENRSLALAVRVAGSDTIFNSGRQVIQPGDLVVWRLPVPGVDSPHMHSRSGEPTHKALPIVEKFATDRKGITEMLRLASGDAYGYKPGLLGQLQTVMKHDGFTEVNSKDAIERYLDNEASARVREAIAEMMETFSKIQNEGVNQRIIGKALTEGQPGRMFDVLLNHTHTVY